MLYLTRKVGESIIINNNIELTVVEVRGRTVKLGFLFPKEATILRKELHDKILAQNLEAANFGQDELLDVEFDITKSPSEKDDDNRGNR
ncbi:MAG: carbon storage regulator [Rickettsiales bacterium]|nr:carbon storage regulator [Rickettsiales bacterium]